jgi:xylan 1,4-beta-xylosidase
LKTMLDSGVTGVKTDIGGLASKGANTATVMVWNYHDKDVQEPAEAVQVNITGIQVQKVKFTEYRIDGEHSNSYEVWKKMGSPQNPTDEQITQLQKAGQLQTMGQARNVNVNKGMLTLDIKLPRQGVSLLKLDW